MANYRVPRFAPTTLQAPRLQSYGDALAPIANWADKMQQLEEKRKDIESQRDFLRERDTVKMQHDFDVAAQNNDYALDRMDIQNDFTREQNEANRGLTREQMAQNDEHFNKNYNLTKTNADRTYGLKTRELNLKERTYTDAQNAQKAQQKQAEAVGSIIGQYLAPTADPMRKGVIGKEETWDTAEVDNVAKKYEPKLKTIDTKMNSILDRLPEEMPDSIKQELNKGNIEAVEKWAKKNDPKDPFRYDFRSLPALAKEYKELNTQRETIQGKYETDLKKAPKTKKNIYGKVFDPDKKLVDIDNKISGLNQALAMTNNRATQTQLLSAINILKNEYSDVYNKYKKSIVEKQAKGIADRAKAFVDKQDKVTDARLDIAKMKYQEALKSGDQGRIAAAEKEYQDLVNNLSYGKK